MRRFGVVIVAVAVVVCMAAPVFAAKDGDFGKGLRYYGAKNYKEAAKFFKAHIAEKPDPAAYYLLGYSLYELGRYDEASRFFEEAYFIDPQFSLEKYGLITPETVASAVERRRSGHPSAPETPSAPAPAPMSEKSQLPAPSGQAEKPAPAPPAQPAAPQPSPAPQPQAPSFPMPPMPSDRQMPTGLPGAFIGMFAGMMMVVLAVGLVFYLFYAFCMFKIGQKLDVPYSWLAFVPVANSFWPLVGAAGKPWWWIFLMLVPLVQIIVIFYLFMCVAENLGKNKWVALILQITLIGYLVLYPWLAFSQGPDRREYEPEPAE